MNLELANSEPFFRFHKFREDFDRNIKVAFGALEKLKLAANAIDAEGKQAEFTVTPTGEEPWGEGIKWKNISPVASQACRFLAQMGLVRVTSAFEDFLVNVGAEHDRYTDLIKGGSAAPLEIAGDENQGGLLSKLCERLKYDIHPVAYLLPLLNYFVTARNCVVHRSARASVALVEQAKSGELSDCLKNWPNLRGKPLPELPQCSFNDELPFLPRHAVLAADVCYRAANYLNAKLVESIGAEGIVYMAAHHALIREDPLPTNAFKSPDRVVNGVLSGRYRIREVSSLETIGILKSLGKWDTCFQSFENLFPEENSGARKT